MSTDKGWNPLVIQENRIQTNNFNSRAPATRRPSHIVIHVTGTTDFMSVKNTFTAPNSVSSHYLVHDNGEIFQFVPDAGRAYHAGIDKNTRALYRKNGREWQKYLKYFSWYKRYPKDAIYLDGDLKPVWDKTEAAFVARSDGQSWSHFEYFNYRWEIDKPINFEADPDPNNYSIGIETLGVGSPSPDPTVYSDAMYSSLRSLVTSLCTQYGILNKKGFVVGHEDVNPVGRFGWDPSRGFEWARIHDRWLTDRSTPFALLTGRFTCGAALDCSIVSTRLPSFVITHERGSVMNTLKYVSLFAAVLMLAGCGQFQVKNTEGLRLAYTAIDHASSKGVELKSLKNITEPQRQEAADLYREAKAVLNGYLQKAITDASGYVVDNTAEGYASTKATEKVEAFEKKVSELRGQVIASAGEWLAPMASLVIAEILKLNDQEQRAAYDRFEKTVRQYMMKSYEDLPSGKAEE